MSNRFEGKGSPVVRGTRVALFRPTRSGVLWIDRRHGIRALIVILQIAALLVILTRLVTGAWALPIGIVVVATIPAGAVIYMWRFIEHSSVEVTTSAVVLTDWLGSVRVIPRSAVARLIRVGVVGFEGPARAAVIAVGSDGAAVFRLGGAFDEVALGRALSVPVEGSFDDRARRGDIQRKYPGSARGIDFGTPQALAAVIVATVLVGLVAYFLWSASR